MKHQMVGYIRVSSVDQHTERQLDGITLNKVFTDKASGKVELELIRFRGRLWT